MSFSFPTMHPAWLLALSISFLLISQSSSSERHVLLFGVDGTRFDAFWKVFQEKSTKYPFFRALVTNGTLDYQIFAGGHGKDQTHQVTSSGPGWSTILSGVWANQHHVTGNAEVPLFMNYTGPTVFEAVRAGRPNGELYALVDWAPLGIITNHGQPLDKSVIFDGHHASDYAIYDENITQIAIDLLLWQNPELLFVYLGVVDETGHQSGFSPDNPNYTAAIEATCQRIDRLMATVEWRRQRGERWLVALCTDHGGHAKDHGSDRYTDRQVFAIFQDPLDDRYSGGQVLDAIQGQTTFLPTILDYLNIPRPKYPIFGKTLGQAPRIPLVMKLKFNATENSVVLEDGFPNLVILSILRPYLMKAIAVTSDLYCDKLLIFLKQGYLIEYSFATRKMAERKPSKISEKFPGMKKYEEEICACSLDRTAFRYFFFLSSGEYVSYDPVTRRVDPGFPRAVEKEWPEMRGLSRNISAAVPSPGNDGQVFFTSTGRLVQTSPSPSQWEGLLPYSKNVIGAAFRKEKYILFLQPLPFN